MAVSGSQKTRLGLIGIMRSALATMVAKTPYIPLVWEPSTERSDSWTEAGARSDSYTPEGAASGAWTEEDGL